MAEERKREKHLGSGLLEDARKKINKRRRALEQAAGTKKNIGGGFDEAGVQGRRERRRLKRQ